MTRRRRPTPKAALRWNLEWGPELEFLLERRARGLDTPALDRRPELDEDLQLLVEAFGTLCRTRAVGFGGPARLTVTDILTVHRLSGWEGRGMPQGEFIGWMLALDDEFLEFHRERAE